MKKLILAIALISVLASCGKDPQPQPVKKALPPPVMIAPPQNDVIHG
jgi:hypothetical protein